MFESTTSLLDTLDLVKNHTNKEGVITGLLLIRDQGLGNQSQIDLMRSALGSIRLAAIHLPYFLLARLVVNIPSDIRLLGQTTLVSTFLFRPCGCV